MHLQFLTGVVLLSAPQAFGDERDLVIKCLETAANANAKEAWRCLNKAVRVLEKSKDLTEAERQELGGRFAEVLRERGLSAAEVLRLMGSDARRQVTRQVIYRRYLEHWMFESPVRLWVTLDCRKGQDAMVRMIRPYLNEN